MKLLIKKAQILDNSSPFHLKIKNVLIEGDTIKEISENEQQADKVIEAEGLKLSPGWFDMRVSLCDPGFEHKEDLESGAASAKYGGFTGMACLPDTKPIIQSKDTISYISNKSRNDIVEIHPYAAVTQDLKGEELSEMLDLHHAGAIGFTDGNNSLWHSGVIIRALQYVQLFDGLIIQHAEERKLNQFGQMNEGITSTFLGLKGMPSLSEELIIARDIELLNYCGKGKIHFSHISSAKSVEIIRQAKKIGLKVSCDVAVANLIFDDKVLEDFNTVYKVNPPLRLKSDIDALWKGIQDGTIDAIVSDHTPQDEESKNLEFDLADFGMIGLETAFAALNTYKPSFIDISLIIQKISTSPKSILKRPNYTIAEGQKANLTLFSDDLEWIYKQEDTKSKSRNSPFYGIKLKGKSIAVFNKGQYFIN